MKTQYYTTTTINGYLADAENSLDWLFQFADIDETEGVEDDSFALGVSSSSW